MDDNRSQISNGQDQQVSGATVVQPPAASQPTPVSIPQKEILPIVPSAPAEFIRPSEIEPQLHPEVVEAGVEAVSEKPPTLELSDQKKGIELSPVEKPVSIPPTGKIQLPLTPIEAKEAAVGNPSNSSTWLGVLVRLVIEKIRFKIEK